MATLPPLSQLLEVQTTAQIAATLTGFLQNPGNGLPPFPVNGWGSTSAGPWIVGSESYALSDLYQTVVNVTMGGYFQLAAQLAPGWPNPTGTSPWVDYGAQQFYNQIRMPSQPTIGPFTFTTSSVAGPYTVTTGQLQVLATNGSLYTNVTAFTIPRNGSINATVQAVTPGSLANIANGTALTLATALPGVTVGTYPLSGSPWYTVPWTDTGLAQAGSNTESDASLISRCINQWSAMGTGSPAAAYVNWAFAASNETRYCITQPTGLGGVNVTVYGSGADVSGTWNPSTNTGTGGLGLIGSYMLPRIPQCVFLAALQNAAQITPVTSIQLYGPGTSKNSALAAANAALTLLIQTAPPGGYLLSGAVPSSTGISNSDFVNAIVNSSGIGNIGKAVVSVNNNGAGLIAGADFFMPTTGGVPVVAVVPSSFNISWNSV